MDLLLVLGVLAVVLPSLYLYTVSVAQTRFPKLRNKRICLLIAHPDDEAMFFAPTMLALTRPETGNHVKILCLNNRSLGMVKQWQDMNYEGRHASSYVESIPDFAKLMEAYGHVGITIEHSDELESKLAEAMAITDRAVFINVMVDKAEHVYPMQIAGQSMQDMWLAKGERT